MTKFVRAQSEYTIQVVSPDGTQLPDNIVISTADDGTVTVNVGGNLTVSGEIPGYVKIADLKTALQDGAGDHAAFKAWVLANL